MINFEIDHSDRSLQYKVSALDDKKQNRLIVYADSPEEGIGKMILLHPKAMADQGIKVIDNTVENPQIAKIAAQIAELSDRDRDKLQDKVFYRGINGGK